MKKQIITLLISTLFFSGNVQAVTIYCGHPFWGALLRIDEYMNVQSASLQEGYTSYKYHTDGICQETRPQVLECTINSVNGLKNTTTFDIKNVSARTHFESNSANDIIWSDCVILKEQIL